MYRDTSRTFAKPPKVEYPPKAEAKSSQGGKSTASNVTPIRKKNSALPDVGNLELKDRYRAYRDHFNAKIATLTSEFGINYHIAAANDSIFVIESQRNWNIDNSAIQKQINKKAGYEKVKNGKVAFGGFQITRETRMGIWKNHFSHEKLPTDQEFLNPDIQKAYMAALTSENIERCLKQSAVRKAISDGIYELSDFVRAMHLNGPSAVSKMLASEAKILHKTKDWLGTSLSQYVDKGKAAYDEYLIASDDTAFAKYMAEHKSPRTSPVKTAAAPVAAVPAPATIVPVVPTVSKPVEIISVAEPIVVAAVPDAVERISVLSASIPEPVGIPEPTEEPAPMATGYVPEGVPSEYRADPEIPVRRHEKVLPAESVRVRYVRRSQGVPLHAVPPVSRETAEANTESKQETIAKSTGFVNADFETEHRDPKVTPLPINSELRKREKEVRTLLVAEMGKNRASLLNEHAHAVVEKRRASAMVLADRISSLETRAQSIGSTDSIPKFYQNLTSQIQSEITQYASGSKERAFAEARLQDVRAEYGFALTTVKKLTGQKTQMANAKPSERVAAILDTASLAYKSGNRYSDVANDELYLKRA